MTIGRGASPTPPRRALRCPRPVPRVIRGRCPHPAVIGRLSSSRRRTGVTTCGGRGGQEAQTASGGSRKRSGGSRPTASGPTTREARRRAALPRANGVFVRGKAEPVPFAAKPFRRRVVACTRCSPRGRSPSVCFLRWPPHLLGRPPRRPPRRGTRGRRIGRWSAFPEGQPLEDECGPSQEAVTPGSRGRRPQDGAASSALQRPPPLGDLAARRYLQEVRRRSIRTPASRPSGSGWEISPRRPADSAVNALEAFGCGGSREGEAALRSPHLLRRSLEYCRNTCPPPVCLLAPPAQRDFAAFCRAMSAPASRPAPPLRSLAGEIDRLEDEILAAYRPPASIDHHRDFILANSALKEARELDAAGLRYGALLRYLQAAQRFAPVRKAPVALKDRPSRQRLAGIDARLSSGRFDDLGGIFLEPRATNEGARSESRAGRVIARTSCPDTCGARARPPAAADARPAARAPPLPTPETSPIRQVCWHRGSFRSSGAGRVSCPRTTATRSSRRSSA